MFGVKSTAHIRIVDQQEAARLVDKDTKIVATRTTHERLARSQMPQAVETARYAELRPGRSAIHLQYKGPPIADDGNLPLGGHITYFLIEVEDYYEDTER